MSETKTQPIEKSACDGVLRPHGCGYRPPPGAVSHLYTGLNGAGAEGRHAMDLNAHGFGDTATYDYAALLRRYGPNFHGIDSTRPRNFALDFESLLGIGSNYLTAKACRNEFGTAGTLSCYPTLEELHDYFAVNPGEAAAALGSGGLAIGGSRPGQPSITAVSSPEPSVVAVSWKTRPNQSFFLVKVGTPFGFDVTSRKVDGGDSPTYATTLLLPPGASGDFVVTVTAFIGAAAGDASMPKTVTVVAAAGEPPVEPPAPVEPPPPPPPPLPGPPPKPPTAPAPSVESRQTIADIRARIAAGKQIGKPLQDRLLKLFDELAP